MVEKIDIDKLKDKYNLESAYKLKVDLNDRSDKILNDYPLFKDMLYDSQMADKVSCTYSQIKLYNPIDMFLDNNIRNISLIPKDIKHKFVSISYSRQDGDSHELEALQHMLSAIEWCLFKGNKSKVSNTFDGLDSLIIPAMTYDLKGEKLTKRNLLYALGVFHNLNDVTIYSPTDLYVESIKGVNIKHSAGIRADSDFNTEYTDVYIIKDIKNTYKLTEFLPLTSMDLGNTNISNKCLLWQGASMLLNQNNAIHLKNVSY